MKGLSLVICTYNGSHRIVKTLESFINIQFDFDWEIVIVDNNSSDNLESVLKFYTNVLPITVVKESKQGLIFARWKAVEVVLFDIILFCDDDNILNEDYIKNGFQIFLKNPRIGVLAGKGEAVFDSPKPSWFDRHQNFYAVGNLGRKSGKQLAGDLVYGAGLFFRKNALMQLDKSGFKNLSVGRNGNLLSGGEDLELTLGVMNLGYIYWFDDMLVFKHFIEKDRLNWGYYLKLSRSIALSYPLIESYKVHQFHSTKNLKNVLRLNQLRLLYRMVILAFKWLKYRDRVYISQFQYHGYQFIGYFKNIQNTIRNFEKMKFLVFSNFLR